MNTLPPVGAPSDPIFDQYLAAVRARRNTLLGVSFGIMTALLVFAWASYRTLASNFSHEHLVTNAQRVGQGLLESAQPQLVDAAKQLVPVYREHAERALEDTLPKLRERALAEFELAQRNFAEKARLALQDAASAPVHDSLSRLIAQFPALKDEQFVAELLEESERTLKQELEGVLVDTHSLYRPQLDRLSSAMISLRSDELHAASNDDLKKRFVHLWLLLIDTELMGSAPCSLDTIGMLPTTTEQGG